VEAAAASRVPDYSGRAIEAALADSPDERARVLVRLAHDLRDAGRPDAALRALDAAWELRPREDVRRTVFAAAVHAHCDLGQHADAEVVEREQAGRSIDEEFALAALRLYSALSRMTGLDVHFSRRAHYLAFLGGRFQLAGAD
jgi:hypothetical protein